jgi:tetratricopeptide (TPR) repeat protein
MRRLPIALFLLTAGLALAQDPQSPERLKSVAERYARAGQPREAAAAYEEVLQVDTNARAVLAPLLVRLYIESKQPRPALAWAQQVMTNTPDPQAYLAGVYEAIGSRREAQRPAGTRTVPQQQRDPRRLAEAATGAPERTGRPAGRAPEVGGKIVPQRAQRLMPRQGTALGATRSTPRNGARTDHNRYYTRRVPVGGFPGRGCWRAELHEADGASV